MNHVAFREPNFRCKLTRKDRPGGKPVGRLIYAESEQVARAQLEQKGYIVNAVEPFDFAQWKKSAEKALNSALAAYQARNKPQFKSAIWAVLKEHLQDLFCGKCAYCEARFLHVAFGDVEHYRPKAAVTEDPAHPGYYWLAYSPQNYFPSCQLCNQGTAKKNHFPIAGKRAVCPEDPLDEEKPLLLNPYRDNPLRHLRFAPSRDDKNPGWAMPVDKLGEVSIDIYELNRPVLVDERREEQENVRLRIKQALNEENTALLTQIIEECKLGKRQFSAAAMAEINDYYARMRLPLPFTADGNGGGS